MCVKYCAVFSSAVETNKRKPEKLITKIDIARTVSRKLPCFTNELVRKMFIIEVFENLSNDEYVKFFKKFVANKEEVAKFKEELESCDFEDDENYVSDNTDVSQEKDEITTR